MGGALSASVKKLNSPLVWGDIPVWAYASVGAIMEALKKVDPITCSHCFRVGEFSRLLAKSAGLSEFQQKIAEFSGILHDVGKIGVGSHIVHKPGRLDDPETLSMRNHSIYSEEIIKPLGGHEFFQQVIPAVRGHHERLDGKGYPDKLCGEEIPLISRVILIVDTLDAMGQDRSYRKGMPIELIYGELAKFAGTQFDKALVNVFLESHKYWGKDNSGSETAELILKKVG